MTTLLICSGNIAKAANKIIRGPYLQELSDNSISINWRTKEETPTLLKYQDAQGQSLEYTDLVLKTEHQAKLSKLEANSKYSYRIYTQKEKKRESLAEKRSATEFYFNTAPKKDTEDFHAHIWVLGDPGTNGTKKFSYSNKKSQIHARDAYYKYRKENKIKNTDLILTLGDNAYWRGTDKEFQKGIFDVYEDELSHTAIFPVYGNHDSGFDKDNISYVSRSYPQTHGAYFDIFRLSKPYYSFDYTGVHFIILDSYDSLWEEANTDGTNLEKIWTPASKATNTMLEWLKQDLQNNHSSWTIVAFHHPPFCHGAGHTVSDIWQEWMRANVVPILDEHKVDLILNGHIHNYQRTYQLEIKQLKEDSLEKSSKEAERKVYYSPETVKAAHQIEPEIKSSSINQYKKGEGSIYLILGSSGAAFRMIDKEHPDPIVASAFFMEGSVILDIDSNKLNAKFLSRENKILDEFSISK
jgi:predicted phosphodiesterase